METTKSADGTAIAYDCAGEGSALIVSVGALCDRRTFVAPAALTDRFTVYTYDRRGRGDSGDGGSVAAEREYEDLAAVAAVAGGRPFVFGHSSGGAIALRAAAAGVSLAGVVAYEAPFVNDDKPPIGRDDPAEHISELVRAGRRGDALVFWMRDVVQAPAEVVAQLATASWAKALHALTSSLPYDLAVVGGGVPVEELARITVPVLIIGGGNSVDWMRRSVAEQSSAIPGARLMMLDGYDHNVPADIVAPLLAEAFQPV